MPRSSQRARRALPLLALALVLAVIAFVAWPSSSRTKTARSAPTTTAPPTGEVQSGVGLDAATWVEQENSRPGTRAWVLTNPATDHQIEGYASAVSVEAGQSVDLYVSTTAPSWRVQAFRMGYYGGAEGRLVWSSPEEAGAVQPPCPVTPGVNMVSCQWTHPLPVSTAGWLQGDYLFKLTASTGWQSYVPLTLRDDASYSAFLVNNSVTTWQAYNAYGGYDLYGGPTGRGGSSLANRARVVSFDRPYALGNGAGDFIGLELPMVAMMESQGLDVSYTTDVDLDEQPSLVLQHRAFVSLGHDEYYSLSMRQALEAARDQGVNLIFLGANAVYRHIRLQPSPLGPDREEIDYKNPHEDPLLGKDNAEVTPWAWRDWPNDDPESRLLGEMWQCNPVRADMVITDPGSWVFAGTGLGLDSRIPGIVGPEYDHFSPHQPNPGDVTVLARSPVVCDGKQSTADMTYYSAPSGAGVWDTGTIDWVGSVAPYCLGCPPPNPVTRVTANVLAAFGVGPAGLAHPSVANAGGSVGGPSVPAAPSTTLPPGVRKQLRLVG